jgi:serine/threonine-protein phosphatase PP1 catalytic subunit
MKYGYEIIGNKQLVTIFSAPNYTGVYGNNGAILIVDEDMNCTITTMDVSYTFHLK